MGKKSRVELPRFFRLNRGRVHTPLGMPSYESRAHFAHNAKRIRQHACSVFASLDGASPLWRIGLAGNVWEWVNSVYQAYPYGWAMGVKPPRRAAANAGSSAGVRSTAPAQNYSLHDPEQQFSDTAGAIISDFES